MQKQQSTVIKNGNSKQFVLIQDYWWQFMFIHDKSLWLFVNHDNSREFNQFITIHDNIWQLITIHDNLWWFMTIHENS